MNDKEYHEHPALNISRLALMADSPRHYYLNIQKESEAMNFGTICHMAILEPQKFKQLYVVEPDTINGEPRNNRLKAHREYIEQWRASQAEGAIILRPEDMDNLAGMILSLSEEIKANRGSLTLSEIFSRGEFEVPLIKEFHGRECKGRADIIVNSKNMGKVVVDLKKVGRPRGASPDEFRRIVSNLHYDARMAWYKDLFDADNCIWIAIEEKPPHAIGIYDASPFYEIGKAKYMGWLERLAECESKNDWPFYTQGVEPLLPSQWQISQFNEENWDSKGVIK